MIDLSHVPTKSPLFGGAFPSAIITIEARIGSRSLAQTIPSGISGVRRKRGVMDQVEGSGRITHRASIPTIRLSYCFLQNSPLDSDSDSFSYLRG